MKLSVVIPALDEAAQIAEAVSSAVTGGVEVLVVDGGSRDGTAERARTAGARVLSSPPGRARQLGIGAEATRGDVVIFLHADTRLPSGWADALRAALADPRAVGGAFRLRFDAGGPALRLVEWVARVRAALFGLPYGDQVLFVRRSCLEAMGGVPQTPIMEDLDLARGLRRRGRLVLLPLAATTSARRYRRRGTLRTAGRNTLAALGWALGVDRGRIAAWYRRGAE